MSSPWGGAGADKHMKNAIGRAEIFSARLRVSKKDFRHPVNASLLRQSCI